MKPLSPNNILNALVFPVLLLPVMTLFVLAGAPGISHPLTATFLYIILFTWISIAARQTYNLHYDTEFLYMNSIGRRLKVPLADIQKIQRSNDGIKVKGLTSWRYTISFHSQTKIAEQSVYELAGSKKVEGFAAIVTQQNPSVLCIDL
jgi:hypothetical protein